MPSRTRNYVSVLYPESAKENWQDILASYCVKAFVSPLHDKDINPDGEPKKPHYHVLLCFNGVKSQEQAQQIFDAIGAIRCQSVNDLVGYARYLVHMDNPEKFQYDPNEVKSFSGGDWFELIRTSSDRYKDLADICDYIVAHGIVSYSYLIDDLRKTNFQWFKVACDNTVYLSTYLKSRDWSNQRIGQGYSSHEKIGNGLA